MGKIVISLFDGMGCAALAFKDAGIETEQRLEPRVDGKTNRLTSVQKDNLVFTQNYVQYDVSGKGYKSQQDRAFYEDGKHGCLATSRAETKSGVFLSNFRIRRLTPIECCRLQTVPDDYFYKDGKQIVSDSAIYKMCGNGWNIKTISHILKYAK